MRLAAKRIDDDLRDGAVMSDQIRFVEDFLRRWADGAEAFHDAIRDSFTPDTVWENVGYQTTAGPDEAIAFLGKGEAAWGRDAIVAEVRAIAATGDTVLTERVDHEYHKDGRLLFSVPVMGIFELRDGRIAAWREYFDTAPVVAKRDATA